MKKGFIFSFDGASAIVIVFLVLGLYAFYYSYGPQNTKLQESLHESITDGVLVGFYTNKTAEEIGLNIVVPDPEPKNFECDYYRVFVMIPSGPLQAPLSGEKYFCRWIE